MGPQPPAEGLAHAREALERARHPLLTTHVNPDGDGLGSELALYHFFTARGKAVTVLNASPTPSFYRFLDPEEEVIHQYRPGDALPQGLDLVVALDLGKWERLGTMAAAVKASALSILCVDHHPVEGDFGDTQAIVDHACATGEIVFDLLKGYEEPLSLPVARALYAAIMTDTGSFRFTNTNARTHRIAAELLEAGVDPAQTYSNIYETTHPERLRLMGMTLSELRITEDGRIGWIAVTQDMLRHSGARPEDTENFVDIPRTVAGVEVSILFIELASGIIRISLRSKGSVRVNETAMSLGGGGHPFAAGVRMQGPLESAIQRVLARTQEAVRAALDGSQRKGTTRGSAKGIAGGRGKRGRGAARGASR